MDLKLFWHNCVRVLKITRKPDQSEFTELVKITGLGLIVIGLIGFIIQIGYILITQGG